MAWTLLNSFKSIILINCSYLAKHVREPIHLSVKRSSQVLYSHCEYSKYSKSKRRFENPLFKTTYGTTLVKLSQKMDVSLLMPPSTVQGMKQLERNAFQKQISVPILKVPGMQANALIKQLKSKLLKLDHLKPVQIPAEAEDLREILLNPLLVKNQDDVQEQINGFRGINPEIPLTYDTKSITLRYENWKSEHILKSVLPEDMEGAASYSLIGHILHVNLKEHLQPYKYLIGQVLLDKTPNATMVVNKTNTIDNTYRNFEMETLAGEGSTITSVKENNCKFTLDFAKVYWNSRLGTEHERIVKKIKQGDVLYDVMAGIGPFTVPSGRKECHVLANDLNPHSYEYLTANVKANKVTEKIKCYNMDGHEFIKTVLKNDILSRWRDNTFCGTIHVTMNLPKCAVEFLPSFLGLINKTDIPEDMKVEETISIKDRLLPLIHVYMFTPDSEPDTALALVAQHLGCTATLESKDNFEASSNVTGNITTEKTENSIEVEPTKKLANNELDFIREHISEVIFVRRVAPNKVMMRVSIKLPLNMIMETENENENEPPLKKTKIIDSESKR